MDAALNQGEGDADETGSSAHSRGCRP